MRGRPVGSKIRQNIIDMLYFLKQGYGYEIAEIYNQIFPKVTKRSIYYNLNRGTALGEFKILKIVKEEGDYSWGREAEKIYYTLGKNAKAKLLKKIKKRIDEIKKRCQ